ncbi:hypothetical protein STENM223S_11713 [Streptomyces tendae]
MPVFQTPLPVAVSMDLGVGHVRLHAEQRVDTVVEITPTDPGNEADVKAADQTVVEYADQKLTVRGPRQRGLFSRSGSIDLTIELPDGSELWAGAREASFYASGRLDSVRIKTSTGDIHLEEAGRLVLNTGVGDITVDRAGGPLEAATGSGTLRIRESADSAVLKSSNGMIVVDRARDNLEAKAANGDVRVGSVARGSVVLGTSIGQVEIGIAPNTTALLDVRSVSGSIHNFMTPADAPDPSAQTVKVVANTTMGDVVVRRSA